MTPPLRGQRWAKARVRDVPARPGVYVLFNRTKKVASGRTFNLRRALEGLSARGPSFTSFDWEIVLREEDRAARTEPGDGRG